MPTHDTLLGRILLERGALTASVLRDAEEDRDRSGRRLDEVLLRRGVVDEAQVAQALAAMLNLSFVAPPLRPDPDALARVQPAVARRKGVLPLTVEGRRLTVAMANPLDTDAVDDLRFQSGCHVEAVAAPRSAVVQGVLDAYGGELPELLESLERPGRRDEGSSLKDLEEEAGAAPIVKIVDHLLLNAIDRRASDIHLETHGAGSRIRFRIDGVLHTATELPPGSHRAAISRVKSWPGWTSRSGGAPRTADSRSGSGTPSSRCACPPSPRWAAKRPYCACWIRATRRATCRSSGWPRTTWTAFSHLLKRRQGVLLASGPTGSGKTTTLSAAVAELAAGNSTS